jgi:predicted GNAT family N-acyltransferase
MTPGDWERIKAIPGADEAVPGAARPVAAPVPSVGDETVAGQRWEIRWATLDEILPLRQAVIIAGTKRDSPYFSGDDHPETKHVGVFEAGECIGCATLLRNEWQGQLGWQLRGMATRPDCRGRGVGGALLRFTERSLRAESDVVILWCNARQAAAPFYEKRGWEVVSDLFEIEDVGPHYKMVRSL